MRMFFLMQFEQENTSVRPFECQEVGRKSGILHFVRLNRIYLNDYTKISLPPMTFNSCHTLEVNQTVRFCVTLKKKSLFD